MLVISAIQVSTAHKVYDQLTSMLLRLVTGLRTTPGVVGVGNPASSPLSFPEEMCNSFVTFEMLSRREDGFLGGCLNAPAKYPPSPILLVPLGDVGMGLAKLLLPLALLELCLLRPSANLGFLNPKKLPLPSVPHGFVAPSPITADGDFRWRFGVLRMASSCSSISFGSKSSSLVLSVSSDASIFTLPKLLDIPAIGRS
jgi:hypothetical protein